MCGILYEYDRLTVYVSIKGVSAGRRPFDLSNPFDIPILIANFLAASAMHVHVPCLFYETIGAA